MFSLTSKTVMWLFLISLVPWALAILAFSAGLAWRYGWRHFFLAPPIYATIHLALGAGFMQELAAQGERRRRLVWPRLFGQTRKVHPDPASELPAVVPETTQKSSRFGTDSPGSIP
jgi:hypothetical protein